MINESPKVIEGSYDFTNFDNVSEYWMKYNGDFMKDAKNGTGILILSNKEKFYGTFENDIINGKGSFMKTDNIDPVEFIKSS